VDSVVTVMGQVVDHETGDPLSGAAVSLAAGPEGTRARGTRVTNADGRFQFKEVPPGAYILSVTLLGYESMRDTLQVPEGPDLNVVLPLSVDPVRLEPIVVEVERLTPAMRDFERRRETLTGTFIDREEIERRYAVRLTDVLWRVPGGRVVGTPPYGSTLLLRGGCRPGIWVDRVRVPYAASLDQLVSPSDVEAIEVYHSLELPVEFGGHPCGGVLIWTRVGDRTPGRPGAWRRLALIAGVLLLGIMLTR
jgi:hypothetical protein